MKKYFNTLEEAYDATKQTNIIGFIFFSSNFTESLPFFNDGVENDFSDNGVVQIYLDQTDLQKILFIRRKIYEIYKEFAMSLQLDCNKSREAVASPINFEAYYGSLDSEVKYTMIPGFILA